MESCKISKEPQNDELRYHREIYAQLRATAQQSENNQSTSELHSPTQELCAIPFNYISYGVMILLDSGKYVEAKALWLINLDLWAGRKKHFTESDYIDIRGYVKDHLPNFLDLTYAKYDYDGDRRSPNPEDHVYRMTLSKFEALGEVRALGLSSDPQLILVNVDGRINVFPPPIITDDYGREFRLQFLLLGMITTNSNHMVLYTSLDEGWWLYDDMKNPLFRAIAMEDIKTQDYVVYLAAYVNVSAKYRKQD